MKQIAALVCVLCIGFELQLANAQATVTPAPTMTPAPWPTMTIVAGQGFPGMPPFPTPVDVEYVPNGFEALSRPHLWALVIHLAAVGVLWHTWVYTRFDAYVTPLEAIMFFFFVFFLFRRKFAKYAGALVPFAGPKTTLVNTNETQPAENKGQETDKA
jgi:hypothetical protein